MNEGISVTLSGSGTDTDGTISSYAWTQTAGPTVTLTGANTATAGFTAPQVTADTVLTFQLTVTDNNGAANSDTVNVTTRNVNQSPIANAGIDQSVNEGASVTLSGSGTDSDGTIASYAWIQTAGSTVTLDGANAATATFTAPQVAADTVLTFQLTVTDNNGASANDTVNITIRNIANVAPTANAGADRMVSQGAAVGLTGSGTDTDGTIASYAWTQTAGPAVTFTGANTATASFTAPSVTANTALTFQLTVTDNSGATGTDSINITVTPPSAAQTPYGATPWAIPGTLQVENFDEGGASIAYNDTTPANNGSAYRTTAVDIEATADIGGGFNIGWTRAGEWLEYTVDIQATGTYTVDARIASPGAGGTFHLEMDGVTIANFTIVNTNGWQTWQTLTRTGINLTAGIHLLRLALDTPTPDTGDVGNINYLRFVAVP